MPIGTILTAASIASTAASAGGSFAQARRSRKLMEDAQREAAESVREARKRGEVNYYDQLAIAKSPYDLEREAMVASAAQAMEAAREASQRGVAATAGRLQQYQARGQRDIASRMESEAQRIEQVKAAEGSRMADMMYNLSMEEAAGAQLAARGAEAARAAALKQGFESVVSLGGQLAALPALYPEQALPNVTTVGDQTVDYTFNQTAPMLAENVQPAGSFGTPPAMPSSQPAKVIDPLTYSMLAGGAEMALNGNPVPRTVSAYEPPSSVSARDVLSTNLPGAYPENPASFGTEFTFPEDPRVRMSEMSPAPRVVTEPQMQRRGLQGVNQRASLPNNLMFPASQPMYPIAPQRTMVSPQLMGQTVPFAAPFGGSPFAPTAQAGPASQSQMAAYLQYLNSLGR